MNRVISYLFIFLPYIVLPQRTLSPSQLSEDLAIFENILKQGHPALYEYTKKEALDSLFRETKEDIKEEKTVVAFFRMLVAVSNTIRDGHLVLTPPDNFSISNNYFPIPIKIIHSQLYTDTDDFEIPIGSKITTINGIKTPGILKSLLKYAPSDGYNLSRKYRIIESQFGLFYSYEYGVCKQFTVAYETPSKIKKTSILPSDPFTVVKGRNKKRSSFFANYHNRENGFDFFSSYINAKKPFVNYRNDSETALLVINSFSINSSLFQSELVRIFKEIRKKKTKNLIIDIRQNDNGYRSNAIFLFSYLAKSLFKQRKSSFVSSLNIPEGKYNKHLFYEEEESFGDVYKNHITIDGWQLNFDNLQPLMVPSKDRFEGKIYVLISGTTFAAGATFAQLAKNDPDILLVGEETGGGYYTNTGDITVSYELPNSKITISLALAKISNYVKDTSAPKGSGVRPDRKIYLTRKDLTLGKDVCLDYVIRLIDKK